MATLDGVIAAVGEQYPHTYERAVLIGWINALEGRIQLNVFGGCLDETVVYTEETAGDTELIVRPPHDDIYVLWLRAQIAAANGEWDEYANVMALYNNAYTDYVRWFADYYQTNKKRCGDPPHYLSAYGVAVRNGFIGTPEEWLASLKGEPGKEGPEGKQGMRGVSGVYVGSGEMPEGYNVQIDPDGDASERIAIGKVETLAAGKKATASITGTVEAPMLNLGIPKGADGKDGKDGATPTIGENDHWFVNGKDTGISAKGPKGDVVLPYIQNGVWYVNGKNTGISAQGPQGVPGPVSEIAIGSVSTAEDGKARAYLSKTEYGVKLNLALPRGEQGPQGEPGKDVEREWEEIYNTTLTEAVTSYAKTIPEDKKYTEVFVQGELYIDTDAASASIDIITGRANTVITRNTVSVKNGTLLYYRAHGWLSPYKTIIYDVAVSGAKAAGGLTRNAGDSSVTTFEYFPGVLIQTSNSTTYKLGAGSTITIWGR